MKITDVIKAHIENLRRTIRIAEADLSVVSERQATLTDRIALMEKELADAEKALRVIEKGIDKNA